MGYASHKIGYDGYAASGDIIVSDATIYSVFGATGFTTKIAGSVLSDLSDVSNLRFKISLQHDIGTSSIVIRVYIGGRLVWEQAHTNPGHTNYTTYESDRTVTWQRGDIIQVKAQTIANTGHLKDFQICGKVSPMRLD